MLNIAICDDEISVTGKLDMLLEKIAKKNFIDIEVEVYLDGAELAKAVEEGERFDIIYLDIEMQKQDGITSAKRIREVDKNVCIIYVTSHENYMKVSFDVRPFQFLVKPVSQEEHERCFLNAYNEIIREDEYFRYRYQRINYKIPIRNILYFESNRRKGSIVTSDEVYNMYGKLNEIESSLNKCKISFLRVHQSYLVNYKHIEGQSYDFVTMDNGQNISISEDRRKMIAEQYCMMEDTFHVDG